VFKKKQKKKKKTDNRARDQNRGPIEI